MLQHSISRTNNTQPPQNLYVCALAILAVRSASVASASAFSSLSVTSLAVVLASSRAYTATSMLFLMEVAVASPTCWHLDWASSAAACALSAFSLAACAASVARRVSIAIAWSLTSLGWYGFLLLAARLARARAFSAALWFFTASFAFLLLSFLAALAWLLTDGFFKIFEAAGFFIVLACDDGMASSFSCRVCVKQTEPKNPRVTCTAQDMSPELSLEHVCLLVCVFVCVFV